MKSKFKNIILTDLQLEKLIERVKCYYSLFIITIYKLYKFKTIKKSLHFKMYFRNWNFKISN